MRTHTVTSSPPDPGSVRTSIRRKRQTPDAIFPGSGGAIVNQGATREDYLAVATLDAPLGATLCAVISKLPEGNNAIGGEAMATAADIRDAITAAAADADAGNVTREDYLRYAAGRLRELAGMPLDRAIAPKVREDLHAAATAAYREGYLSYADYYTVDVWLAHSRRGRRGPAR